MDQLTIHHIAIHKIDKRPEEATAEISLSEGATPITENAIEVVAKLDQQMERKNDMLQGYLMAPDESLFAGLYTAMLEAGRSRPDFLDFAKVAAYEFLKSLNGTIGTKGGDLVFADYTIEGQRILGVYLVQSEPVFIVPFLLDDSYFEVGRSDVPNFAKPAASLRILAGGGRNVQLSFKDSGAARFFTDWCGIIDAETSAELTAEFLDIIEELPVPKDRETGFAMNEGDFERALLKYAKKAPQQIIRAKAFDEHFYGNEHPLSDALDLKNGSILDGGFKADNRAMRKHYNLKASFGGIAVACTQDHFRDGQVEVDEATGKITIINPEVASLLLDAKGE